MAAKIRKGKLKKDKLYLIGSAFAVIFSLFFLYFFKYKNQHLSLSEFNLLLPGNLLNLFFSISISILLLVQAFSQKKLLENKILFVNLIVMFVFLIIASISVFFPKSGTSNYLFDHPIYEVITAFFFSAYQFMQFFIIALFWNTFMRRKSVIILRSGVQSLIIIVFLYAFAFFYSYSTENFLDESNAGNNNTAIVLGSAVWKNNTPSPSLAGRVEKALELTKKGIVNKIVFTGGNAPGELSEAETAYNYLKSFNVPVGEVITENNTTSTTEQIQYIKSHFTNSDNLNKVIIISDVFHLPRINEICKFHNFVAKLQGSDLQLSFEKRIFYKIRESTALLIFWFFSL